MKNSEIQIMLVEDETVYSKIILFLLSKIQLSDSELTVNHVSSLTEMKEFGEYLTPDIILLDLGLPESNGIDTFISTRRMFPDSAIIILSGTDDDALAGAIVRNGAQDYLIKTDVEPRVLKKTIEYTLERFAFQESLKKATMEMLTDLNDKLSALKRSFQAMNLDENNSSESLQNAIERMETSLKKFSQNSI